MVTKYHCYHSIIFFPTYFYFQFFPAYAKHIQAKLNVVENTIEPELTAIEKFHLPIPQWKIQPKLNDVEKLKAEEKLKALREDWLKLIKIKKAYTAAEKR